METSSEVPMFVDVNRGSEYTELNKQNFLAFQAILKEPVDNEDVSHQMAVQDPGSSAQAPPDPDEVKDLVKQEEVKPRIRCPECHRYTTDSEERMLRHIRKNHQGLNPFQCSLCEYSTYNKSVFEEHVRIHKGIKPFQCAHCPYRSASKKNKNKHELIHRKNNPLKCDLCPFIAHHYRSLLCHKQKHKFDTKNVELQCELCLYNFSTAIALKKHKTNHKSQVCDVCNATFCSSYYLRKHVSSVHEVKKESFKCEECGWHGSTKVKILLHLIHHPNQIVDETVFDLSVLRKHGIVS